MLQRNVPNRPTVDELELVSDDESRMEREQIEQVHAKAAGLYYRRKRELRSYEQDDRREAAVDFIWTWLPVALIVVGISGVYEFAFGEREMSNWLLFTVIGGVVLVIGGVGLHLGRAAFDPTQSILEHFWELAKKVFWVFRIAKKVKFGRWHSLF